MNRNDLLSTAGETLAYAEDFIDTRIELLKLNVAEKGAKSGANVLAFAILGTVGLFALGCFTVALSIWIGSLLSSMALGFAAVGLVYLIFAALLFLFREAILTTPLLRALITQLFKS
ncbi:MAG: phage holin family protein [Saprospiraceae bacterium]